ncbi:MAG: hypothetical protein O2890_02610 [Cyanobacteria bacterium]|nr:hypothetical protein [Cyanobacteriota bacterium]MDA0865307.1 hypothetical protein [Cyanobacteriota bacterium]
MAASPVWATAALTLGLLASGAPVQAETPAVYYSWRSLAVEPTDCVVQARAALENQRLFNIQIVDNSVSGRTETATAVIVCLEQGLENSTLMVVVSSLDDDAAIALREALKAIL